MKKLLALILLLAVIVVGCTGKYTCTLEQKATLRSFITDEYYVETSVWVRDLWWGTTLTLEFHDIACVPKGKIEEEKLAQWISAKIVYDKVVKRLRTEK